MTKKILSNIVTTLGVITDDVKLTFNEKGLTSKSVDSAHVSMVDVFIPSTMFNEYTVEGTEIIAVGMSKLKDVASLGDNDTEIDVETVDGKLCFKIGKIKRSTALLDGSNMSEPKIPNMQLPVSISMPVNDLQVISKGTDGIAEALTMTANEDGLKIDGIGDLDAISMWLPKDVMKEYIATEEYKSLYSLDYIASIFKSIKKDTVIKLEMDTDKPIRISYTIDDMTVMYMLAPRIEND